MSQLTIDSDLFFFLKIVFPLGFFLITFFFLNFFFIKKKSYSIIILYIGSILYYWIATEGLLFITPYPQSLKIVVFCLYLLLFLCLGLYQSGGMSNLIDFFEDRLKAHPKELFGLDTLAVIRTKYKVAKDQQKFIKTASGKINYSYLLFSWLTILVLSIKETMKKFIYLFILSLFCQCGFVDASFYVANYLIVIFTTSLIGIDKEISDFINHYYGPYVLGWLGSYQFLGAAQNFEYVSATVFKHAYIVRNTKNGLASGAIKYENGKYIYNKPKHK